jgi:hypothetical protein
MSLSRGRIPGKVDPTGGAWRRASAAVRSPAGAVEPADGQPGEGPRD